MGRLKDIKEEDNIKITSKKFQKKLKKIEKRKYKERVRKEAIKRKNYEKYIKKYERDVGREKKKLDDPAPIVDRILALVIICIVIIVICKDFILPIFGNL